jgi:hypothetical protein
LVLGVPTEVVGQINFGTYLQIIAPIYTKPKPQSIIFLKEMVNRAQNTVTQNSVTYLLKAGIVKSGETAVAGQQHGNKP